MYKMENVIPLTYSMDSSSVDAIPLSNTAPVARPRPEQQPEPQPEQQPQQQRRQQQQRGDPQSPAIPPAYDLHRTEANGGTSTSRPSYASATTEDSVYYDDESTSFSHNIMIGGRGGDDPTWSDPIIDNALFGESSNNRSTEDDGGEGVMDTAEDATSVIRRGYLDLLRLLSRPHLFREALEYQAKLDMGIDRDASAAAGEGEDIDFPDASGFGNTATTTEDDDDEEEEDSTFRGLQDDDDVVDGGKKGVVDSNDAVVEQQRSTSNETFAFDPFGKDDEEDGGGGETSSSFPATKTVQSRGKGRVDEEGMKRRYLPPLPHRIFAPDAEVVLPQAMTASQLFGIERETGIELEAAAGMTMLCTLFGRWLAIMPEGDHDNPMDPPGLTIMKISGGGYRVTAAHRVVWRWMNKFSPNSTLNGGPSDDFDFGDLVAMTIVDVFETDVNGLLLSYCPTFDNRAVHKTPEMAQRIRKGVGQMRETIEVVANSPVGKSVNMAAGTLGKLSVQAALVLGNAVKNKIQHNINGQYGFSKSAEDLPEEDRLNELSQSHIDNQDETVVDINAVNTIELEGDPKPTTPKSQSKRRMAV
ncbi:hypothetical protein ACHAXA_000008 [Cyclostephanos tholiformis]|uniref:Uncharacterized protein n=1 Tax=Cyclostephanos tholiformis TaxID=382380 RepID=A0ABD3R735_9STRA